MRNKGSALMQVIVVGLIVAAFSVLMLRYAVTRSANLTRTQRILESQTIADSCLDQYMSFLAYSELYGVPPTSYNMDCLYYTGNNTISSTTMWAEFGAADTINAGTLITSFTITHQNVD